MSCCCIVCVFVDGMYCVYMYTGRSSGICVFVFADHITIFNTWHLLCVDDVLCVLSLLSELCSDVGLYVFDRSLVR